MKAHIGVDADPGLVHTVVGVGSDAGYQGDERREDTRDINTNRHPAMRPGKRRALDKDPPLGKLPDEIERVKARIRAKVNSGSGGSSANSGVRKFAVEVSVIDGEICNSVSFFEMLTNGQLRFSGLMDTPLRVRRVTHTCPRSRRPTTPRRTRGNSAATALT